MGGIMAVLTAPIARFAEAPDWSRPLGLLAAFASLLLCDLFFGFLVFALIPATIGDFYFGAVVARLSDRYDSVEANKGWNGKLAGILLLCLVRSVEWWASQHQLGDLLAAAMPGTGGDTHGAVATLLAVGLFGAEIESIENHRTRLGAGPIPGIFHLARALRRVWVGRIPVSKEAER